MKSSMNKQEISDPLDSIWRSNIKAGQWIPDILVDNCMICTCTFTLWRRKHHCRRCGAVVCDPCSNNRSRFIGKGFEQEDVSNDLVRVCDPCIRFIDYKLTKGIRDKIGQSYHEFLQPEHDAGHSNSNENNERNKKEYYNIRSSITIGKYRADIKESEGNRYIIDKDL